MEMQPTIDRIRRWVALVERVVPWLALVAAAVGLSLVLRTQRDALAALDWSLPWQAAAAGVVAFSLAPLMQGLSFWLALRLLTGTAPLGDSMLVWSRSYVVRYAPTGALAIAYRLSARRRLTASGEQVLAAYGYEHVATLAAGAAACLLLFALAGGTPPLPALVIAVAALALTAAVRPGGVGRAAEAIGRRLGVHVSAVLSGRQLAALVALNALGWLGTAAGVHVIVTALTGESAGFLWLAGSYTAGYLVGFVAPLAPGGLGAREGMLVVLLRGRYGLAAATGVSLAIRVVNVAGELLAVAFVHSAYGAAAAWRRGRSALTLEAAAAAP
jgi:glycosyltransferase 2 family protein